MADDKVISIWRGQDALMEVGGLPDEFGVCLAIYGDSLRPAEVSRLLGVAPTHAHVKGEPKRRGRGGYSGGAWLLEVRAEAPSSPGATLEELCERLPDAPDVWESLASQYSIQIRFGIHFSGWNKGFDLSKKAVSRIAAMRAGLGFDLYAYGEDEDES